MNLCKIQGFFTLQLACYIVFTVLSMIVPSILAWDASIEGTIMESTVSPCKYRRYNHGDQNTS